MTRFVLVHGAWSDGAAWKAVAAQLRSAGHQVTAPDLLAHGADNTLVPGTDGVATTRRLPVSHMAMLSDPDGLAAALLDLTA